ncbi:MAG: hypothetical protein HC905_22775, partial [Bacteroidales bacterium]|nr:hypothetical protein [Bacteroidales bacterium]
MSILFLKSPSAVELAGNTIHLKVAGTDAFVAGFIQPFYRIGIRIQENNNEIVTCERPVYEPTQDDNVPEGSGIMQINIEDVLRKEYKGHFTFPEPDAGLHFTHSILREIQVFVYEKFGVPPVDQPGELSEVFRVLQGKISIFRQGELNYLEKSWWESFLEKPQFLTSANPEKTIDIYQPERLYFLFPQAGTFKLKVREFYKDVEYDEQNETITKLFEADFSNWAADSDPQFPAQPFGIDISSPDEGTMASNYFNKLLVTIPYSDPGIPKIVNLMFKSPNNILAAGSYTLNINIEDITIYTQVNLLSSAGHNIALVKGQNSIKLFFADFAFVRLLFSGEGTCLITSLVINNTTTLAQQNNDYVALFEKDVFNVQAFDVKEFLTSYYKLRSDTGKKIIKYKVIITDNSDETIAEWLYRIDYKNYDYARYFMFLNEFGVYEVLRTTGKGRKTDEVKKSTVKLPLRDNFNSTERAEKQIAETEEVQYTVNSGFFKNKFEADWFR